jgi:hypothetical protein
LLREEAKAWGINLSPSGPKCFTQDLVKLDSYHLVLALLTAEGPGKKFLEELGITLDSMAEYSPHFSAAKELVSDLPEARKIAASVEVCPLSYLKEFIFSGAYKEAEKLGCKQVEPLNVIFALSNPETKGPHLPIPYEILCAIVDKDGQINLKVVNEMYARASDKCSKLQVKNGKLQEALDAIRKAENLISEGFTNIENSLTKERKKAEWLAKFQTAARQKEIGAPG